MNRFRELNKKCKRPRLKSWVNKNGIEDYFLRRILTHGFIRGGQEKEKSLNRFNGLLRKMAHYFKPINRFREVDKKCKSPRLKSWVNEKV